MFKFARPSHLNWRLDFSRAVTFCVWVLQLDGLAVSPFDKHANGNESLRTIGLTARSWAMWFDRVVAAESERSQFPPLQRSSGESRPVAFNPAMLWPDESAIGHRLHKLWWPYYESASGPLTSEEAAGIVDLGKAGVAIGKDLRSHCAHLSKPLCVFIIDYPYQVTYAVPPSSLVLGSSRGAPTSEQFRRRVIDAASDLARTATTD